MPKPKKEERLSELEHVVLGIVWKKGPCTSHAVRVEFVNSANTHFSGSAGSIYPLVRRLEQRGLVEMRADRHGQQDRRLVTITAAGRRALRGWLAPPFRGEDFSVQYDPIRTRFYFLGALTGREQERFLDEAEAGFRQEMIALRETRARYQEQGWLWSALATEGVLGHCRAQLQWLRRARKTLSQIGKSRG